MLIRPTNDHEIREWAQARGQAALTANDGRTGLYLPRFRDRSANEIVRHPSIHVPVPSSVAREVNRRITGQLRRNGIDISQFHQHETTDWHVTYGWVNPGKNPVEDQAIIDDTVARKDELLDAIDGVPQTVFTITGVVVHPIQIMVTYSAETWNNVLPVMGKLREEAEFFSKGGYALDKGPLEMGQILQSTALMVTREEPSQPIVDALKAWAPGGDFEPISFVGTEIQLALHQFSPDRVLHREAVLAEKALVPVPGLELPTSNSSLPGSI